MLHDLHLSLEYDVCMYLLTLTHGRKIANDSTSCQSITFTVFMVTSQLAESQLAESQLAESQLAECLYVGVRNRVRARDRG